MVSYAISHPRAHPSLTIAFGTCRQSISISLELLKTIDSSYSWNLRLDFKTILRCCGTESRRKMSMINYGIRFMIVLYKIPYCLKSII